MSVETQKENNQDVSDAGNRFKVENLEVRIINDDNVIAKILDPTDISYV